MTHHRYSVRNLTTILRRRLQSEGIDAEAHTPAPGTCTYLLLDNDVLGDVCILGGPDFYHKRCTYTIQRGAKQKTPWTDILGGTWYPAHAVDTLVEDIVRDKKGKRENNEAAYEATRRHNQKKGTYPLVNRSYDHSGGDTH